MDAFLLHPDYRYLKCETVHYSDDKLGGVSNHRRLGCLLDRFSQAQIKESIKAPRRWPLWEETTGDRWIPHTKGNTENVSVWCHHDAALKTYIYEVNILISKMGMICQIHSCVASYCDPALPLANRLAPVSDQNSNMGPVSNALFSVVWWVINAS